MFVPFDFCSFLWIENFFFQLSRVVDRNVYLNICLELKIFTYALFIYFYMLFIGWLFIAVPNFLFLGASVHLYQFDELIINKFSGFIIYFFILPFFFTTLSKILSEFLCNIRFLISQFIFDYFFVKFNRLCGGLFYFYASFKLMSSFLISKLNFGSILIVIRSSSFSFSTGSIDNLLTSGSEIKLSILEFNESLISIASGQL